MSFCRGGCFLVQGFESETKTGSERLCDRNVMVRDFLDRTNDLKDYGKIGIRVSGKSSQSKAIER